MFMAIMARRVVAALCAWLVSGVVFAQSEAVVCPPPPAVPTSEQVQVLAKAAKDRGFLWKLEKNGATGYLYGSMHIGKLEWVMPGAKTMAALNASSVVALELDILDPQVQEQMKDPANFGIKAMALAPSLQRRMNALAERVCVPEGALAKLHPMMQMVTVTLLDARFADLEIGYGNEVFLSSFARSAKKTVVSLETAERQMKALLGVESAVIQEAVENSIKLFEAGKQRVQTQRMINAWANGDLDELQRYAQWCECMDSERSRQYMKGLLDDRNAGLAAGIDKVIGQGQTVFAAVGALHMTGPQALPKLMQSLGYRVQRVVFER